MEDTQVFLATTALEEFWDTRFPVLFLGEWCQRYGSRSRWESLAGRLMESPWAGQHKVLQAADYVEALYERVLPVLADALNRRQGTRHGLRFWRILLGPWLQLYLPIVFDRYSCLKKALALHPGLTTTLLAEESWATPADTLEFVEFIKEDLYNLQICSRLLQLLGGSYPSSPKPVAVRPVAPPVAKSALASLAAAGSHAAVRAVSWFYGGGVVLMTGAYFSRPVATSLIVKSRGRVLPALKKPCKSQGSLVSAAERGTLVDASWARDEFERLLAALVSRDLPRAFVEDFGANRNCARASYPRTTGVILSANSWYYDEVFKQWAAAATEAGAQLFGVQHGGNYGSTCRHPSEDHEIAISDRYGTWGWTRKGKDSVLAMPAAKLICREPTGADNRKQGILYVATSLPRFLFQFPYVPAHFQAYLEWQTRFVKLVSLQVISELRVRLHREDLGWDIEERWKTDCIEIAREGWEVPLTESMENCRLYVCDNLQTTFIEGLVVNKPGVLFWNPEHNPIREEARPYYDGLRTAGILHDSPEAAARVVNEVYGDVEAWWNEPTRQAARRAFCERFALTAPDALERWLAALKGAAGSAAHGAGRE